jgi:dephospho-CoA kinase
VALTGGLASGKSFCRAAFASLGAPTVDADLVAHDVLAPGTAAHADVIDRFGAEIVRASGDIDRAALAAVVFADREKRRELEAIVHPAVYHAIQLWFERLTAPVGIADIPLLYETGRAGDFDRVVVAACRPEQQLERAIARGLAPADARARLAAQWPLAEKVRRADFVIDTSRTRDETTRQVAEVWARLQEDVSG